MLEPVSKRRLPRPDGSQIEVDTATGTVRLIREDGQDLILGSSLTRKADPFSLSVKLLSKPAESLPPGAEKQDEEAGGDGLRDVVNVGRSLISGIAEGGINLYRGILRLEGLLAGEVAYGLGVITGNREAGERARQIAREKFLAFEPDLDLTSRLEGPGIDESDTWHSAIIKLKNFALQRPGDFASWAAFNVGQSLPATVGTALSFASGAPLVGAALTVVGSAGEIGSGKAALEVKDVPLVLAHAALEYASDLVLGGAFGAVESGVKKVYLKRAVKDFLARNPDATLAEAGTFARRVSRLLDNTISSRAFRYVSAAASPVAEGATEYIQSGIESFAQTGQFAPSKEAALAGALTGGVIGAAGGVLTASSEPQVDAFGAALEATFEEARLRLETAEREALMLADASSAFEPPSDPPPFLRSTDFSRSRVVERIKRPEGIEEYTLNTPGGTALLEYGQEVEIPEPVRIQEEVEGVELFPRHKVRFSLEGLTYRVYDPQAKITPENLVPQIDAKQARAILKEYRGRARTNLRLEDAVKHPVLLKEYLRGAPEWVTSLEDHIALMNLVVEKAIKGSRGKRWYHWSSETIGTMFGFAPAGRELPLGELESEIRDALPADAATRRKMMSKFVKVLGVVSSQAPVKDNWVAALQVFQQYLRGEPITAGRNRVQNRILNDLLYRDKDWSGLKTNSFYRALTVLLGLEEDARSAFVFDRWMLRAFGYDRDNYTPAQYDYATRLAFSAADALGWDPIELQAAVWTYEKGFTEFQRSLDRKLASGKLSREEYGKLIREFDPYAIEPYSFRESARELSASFSFEVLSGRWDPLASAPREVRLRFTQRIAQVARDILLSAGIFPIEDANVLPGYWVQDGQVFGEPSIQIRFALSYFGTRENIVSPDDAIKVFEREGAWSTLTALGKTLLDSDYRFKKGTIPKAALEQVKSGVLGDLERALADGGYGSVLRAYGVKPDLGVVDYDPDAPARDVFAGIKRVIYDLDFSKEGLEEYKQRVLRSRSLTDAFFDGLGVSVDEWFTFWDKVNRAVGALTVDFVRGKSIPKNAYYAVSKALHDRGLGVLDSNLVRAIELAGHIVNYAFGQNATGWSVHFPTDVLRKANGIFVSLGRAPQEGDVLSVYNVLSKYLAPDEFVPVSTPDGIRVLIFADLASRKINLREVKEELDSTGNNAYITSNISGLIEFNQEVSEDAYPDFIGSLASSDDESGLVSAQPLANAARSAILLRQYYLQTALSGEFGDYVSPEDAARARSELEYLRGRIAQGGQSPGRAMEASAFEGGFGGAYEERSDDLLFLPERPGGFLGELGGSRGAEGVLRQTLEAGDRARGEDLQRGLGRTLLTATASSLRDDPGGDLGVGGGLGSGLQVEPGYREEAFRSLRDFVEEARSSLERAFRARASTLADIDREVRALINEEVWTSLAVVTEPVYGGRLVGRIVQYIDDIARLVQIYRNPHVEVFRAIFIDEDGKIVDEEAYSAFLPHTTPVYLSDDIQASSDYYASRIRELEKREGKRIYVAFSHNHPSGNSKPSSSDERVYSLLTSHLRDRLGYDAVYATLVTDKDHAHVRLRQGKDFVWQKVFVPVNVQESSGYIPPKEVEDWGEDMESWRAFVRHQLVLAKMFLKRDLERTTGKAYAVMLSVKGELRGIVSFDDDHLARFGKNPQRSAAALAARYGSGHIVFVLTEELSPKQLQQVASWGAKEYVSGVIDIATVLSSTSDELARKLLTGASINIPASKVALFEDMQESGHVFYRVHRIVDPRAPSELATPAPLPDERAAVQMVDRVMRLQFALPNEETFREWFEAAKERLQREDERRRILSGRIIDATDVIAAKLLIDEVGRDAIERAYRGDDSRLDDLVRLVIGYRTARTEIARAMVAGRDPVRSPWERFFEAALGAIFYPTDEEIAALKRAPSIEERERVLLEIKRRAQSTLAALAQAGVRLDEVDFSKPVEAAIALRKIQIQKPGGLMDWLIEYWLNAILSGPATHVVNFVSNAIQFTNRLLVERLVKASLNLILRDPDAPSWGEFVWVFRSILKHALPKAWMRAKLAFSAELGVLDAEIAGVGGGEAFKGEPMDVAIPGKTGRFIRIPRRLLLFADEIWKNLAAYSEAGAIAYRAGKRAGLDGEALESFVDRMLSDPQSIPMQEGYKLALRVTFQEEVPEVVRSLIYFRERHKWAYFILPFVVTPVNIFRQGLRYTPFGTVRLAYALLKGAPRDEILERLAEQAVGWFTFWTVLTLVGGEDDDDKLISITGSAGTSRGEIDFTWRVAPPLSIRIGNTWFSYARLDPFAIQLQTWVDVVQALRLGAINWEEAGKRILEMAAGLVYDKTFIRSLSDLAAVSMDPASGIVRAVQRYSTSFIPSVLRSIVRSADPYLRDTKPLGDGVFWTRSLFEKAWRGALLPWSLEPRVDLWGRPIEVSVFERPLTDFLFRLVAPMRTARLNVHPVDLMLLRWNTEHPDEAYFPAPPDRTFTFRGVEYWFSDAAYAEFLKLAGRIASAELAGMFPEVPEKVTREHIELVRRTIAEARRVAREILVLKYEPQIFEMPRTKQVVVQ